jgi:hypothetical protein
MARTIRFFLALPLFFAFAAGCNTSNTPATVSGKVTYNGQPVPAGSITFHPVSDKSTDQGGLGIYNYSIKDGMYSGTDLPTGEMVVTIETETANPNPTKAKAAPQGAAKRGDPTGDYQKKMQEMGKVPADAATNAGPYVKIPPRYAVKAKSPLKVTVTKGKNTNDFDLTE